MLAIQEGHVDIVELLIENHADLDMQNKVHPVTQSCITYHVQVSYYKHVWRDRAEQEILHDQCTLLIVNCPCTFDIVSMDLLHLCVQWVMEWWKL